MATPKKRRSAPKMRVTLTFVRKGRSPAREVISFSNLLSAHLYAFGPNGIGNDETIANGYAVSSDGKTRMRVEMHGRRNPRVSALREFLGAS